MLNEAIADQASIYENEDRVAVELLNFRLRNKAVQADFARLRPFSFIFRIAPPGRRLRQPHTFQRLHRGQRNQLLERFLSKNLVHALPMSSHRWGDQQCIGRRMQLEMFFRMRQSIMRHQRRDVRQFGRFRLQKFLPCRRVKEKITHRNRSPQRQPSFFHADHLPAIDLDHRSGGLFLRAGFKMQARDRSNRRQRLAPETKRRNS